MVILVPSRSRDRMSRVAPTSSARSRIPRIPYRSPGTADGSNPRPLSATEIREIGPLAFGPHAHERRVRVAPTLLSASWTIRRTSASVRGGRRDSVAVGLELGADVEPLREILDVRAQHLLEARRGRRIDPHRHDRLACLRQRGIDRVEHFARGRPGLGIEARAPDDASLLELGEP